MGRMDDIQMLRVTDDTDSTLVCTCVPRAARGHLRIGNAEAWAESNPVSCIAIDTNGLLQITDPSLLSAIGAWFGAAAVWLKTQQMRDEQEDMDRDWDDDDEQTEGDE